MAGLRKPIRRKDPLKPSTPLILFLVFFIILSLGLGIWGYYGYRGQEELRTKTRGAKAEGLAGNTKADYFLFVSQEGRMATGDTLTPDETTAWQEARVEFTRADGKFNTEPSKAAIEKWIEENRKRLGLDIDPKAKGYNTNFREKVSELEKNLKAAQAALSTAQADLKAANDRFATLDKNQKDNFKKHEAAIAKGNKQALDEARASTEERKKAFETIVELQEQLAKLSLEKEEQIGKLQRLNKKLETVMQTEVQKAKELAVANPGGLGGGQHSLLLDTAKGKTLWDTPLGKITLVDLQNGQVHINLGSANNIKPEVTFNIFGANSVGMPERMMKGTIEVIRVIDRSSSVARITSLYDADGREIALGESTRGRLEREASNALKQGDLLFNLFWGTKVAIAGMVNYTEFDAKSPAEEMRQLDNFIYQLGRMGASVDASIDLNDGSIKGAIVPRTRYLIVGAGYVVPKAKEGEEKDKGILDRGAQINESMKDMRKLAADNGLFIISLDNFLTVSGVRNPRSAGFNPSLPYAGQGLSSLIGPATKTPEVKDKEK